MSDLDQVHVSGSSELTCSVIETVALVLLEADDFKIPRKPGRDVDPEEISWIRGGFWFVDDEDGAMTLFSRPFVLSLVVDPWGDTEENRAAGI